MHYITVLLKPKKFTRKLQVLLFVLLLFACFPSLSNIFYPNRKDMTVLEKPIVYVVIPFDGRENKYETYMENLQRIKRKEWKIQTIVVQHDGNISPFSRAFLLNIGIREVLKRRSVKCIATLNLDVSVPPNVDFFMCDKPKEVCGDLTCINHVDGVYVSSANIVLASAEHWEVVNGYTNKASKKEDVRANLYHRFKASGLIRSHEKLTDLANKKSCKCIDQNADERKKKTKQIMYHSDDSNEWKTDGLTNTKYCIDKSYTDKFGSTRLKINSTLKISNSEMAMIKRPLYTSAIVLLKYKLIFFWSEKSGCTYWKRIFQYIQGIKMIMTEENAHHAFKNGLFTITHFKDSEVLSVMNNDSWTKVAFVREPRERILSSFLDKGLDDHFMKYFCKKKVKSLSEFIKLIKTCKDRHWESQVRLPRCFYNHITIGYMSDIKSFTMLLLKKVGAWNDNVEKWLQSKNVSIATRPHARNAKEKILKYYTRELEQDIFDMYADEYDVFHFEKKLFHS